ncbi:Protein Iojap, chloroplastic [Zostera marina]|uniref:Protein Iojap, chloroplastic n=1 Tax=Zostera marina TaxID=29655 RepID=A0A0K9Q483_ZOSMR|nr:Protein Iojap, chloroplastic [Zostera marina]
MQMSAAVSTTTAHLWPPLFLPICNNKLGGERSMNFFCCRNGPVRFPHLQKVSAQKQPENDINEESDEMFDDLFKKYGKVVYDRNDKKSPSAEADDDAASLSFAINLAKVASDVKASDIRVLFVKPLVYWTHFFIIVTAFSRPQIDAISSRMRDIAEKKHNKVPTGDSKPNSWTLLDFGDVVVHIFLPQQRAFYNLEEFYGNATLIDLPFDNQIPFQG